jgi:hypothetical protein
MFHVEALKGRDGMIALMEAFRVAGDEFDLGVICAVPVDSSVGYHLLFTIGTTTAAMTLTETKWLSETLIQNTSGLGRLSRDLQSFGRMLASILAEAPGPHGTH